MATEVWPLEGVAVGAPDMVANSLAGRVIALASSGAGYVGDGWYVDGVGGNDSNTGRTASEAFETIGHAISEAAAGDAIYVGAGTYDENGLDLDKDSLELYCEIGVILTNSTPATVLTMSGDYCLLDGARITQAGQVGVHVTGARCEIYNAKIGPGNSISFDIDGSAARLRDCHAGQPTTTGFDIGANGCSIRWCSAIGTGAAARGFYIHGNALRSRIYDSDSIGNATAGFEIASGSNYCLIDDCASGGQDGDRVDDGQFNFWPGYANTLATEHHERIYPYCAGTGAANNPVTVSNSTTDDVGGARDDQNYWGDVVRLVPPDVLTVEWWSIGIYIYADTANDIQQWQVFFTDDNYKSAQNGGNDWDHLETQLTVADGGLFQADDFVWITGTDRAEGEILKVDSVAGNVVTIVSETRASGSGGLRYDYDIAPGSNAMYVVYRPTERHLHMFDGDHSAAGSRDFVRFVWHAAKLVRPSGAMLIRMLNASDALTSSFDARAIYED